MAALLHVSTVHLLVCSQPCSCLFGTRLPFDRRLLFPLVYPSLILSSVPVLFLASSHARISSIICAIFVEACPTPEQRNVVCCTFLIRVNNRELFVVSHRLLDIKMQNIEYIIPRTCTMRNAMLTLVEETNECSTSTLQIVLPFKKKPMSTRQIVLIYWYPCPCCQWSMDTNR